MHEGLHPRLTQLLESKGWEGLTDAQQAAFAPIASGDHTLVLAPTGHGKTEAALLPILSRLLTLRENGELRPGFHVLYVTPLRALNRDLLERLESWGSALGLDIGVRHGDTTPSERARQSRRPPDVLITTPETVQLLLYGDRLRQHVRGVRAIVIDEIHDLAASERGAQLTLALERIEEAIAQGDDDAALPARQRPCPPSTGSTPAGFQRIGLSATIADPDAIARFMAGARPVRIVPAAAEKRLDVKVAWPQVEEMDRGVAGRLGIPPPAAAELREVRHLVASHERTLVFCNTRDGAEMMVSRSGALDAEDEGGSTPLLDLHHGSLSAEHRADVERRFKAGELRGLVATSSLELGIDVGAIDHIVQVHSPRSVARLVQRLGRAGHRVGLVSSGTLVAHGAEDAMECMAVGRMAMDGRLEPIDMRPAPLVVLANQVIAASQEFASLEPEWFVAMARRAGPFMDLDDGMWQAVWHGLLDLRTMFAHEDRPSHMGRSGRARRHFIHHIGVIPDERTYRVVDESTKRSIGTVDDSFVAATLHPGARFIMAGRAWTVLEIEADRERVRVAPSKDLAAAPQWAGSQLPVSRDLAVEVGRLRHAIATRDAEALAEFPKMPGPAVAAPIDGHLAEGLQVPTDRTVTLEGGRGVVVVNACLGTRGNEALGRVTQALLHQRTGQACGLQTDAYRIHLSGNPAPTPGLVEETWRSIDPASLDLLLALVLRDSPLLRHHLVHVAKQFGGLPAAVDPNRTTRRKMDDLMSHLALHEETMDRLLHERLDVPAVKAFLSAVNRGDVAVVSQAIGPLSRLGDEENRALLAAPPADDALLAAVRERIEGSDILWLCTNCKRTWNDVVTDAEPRPRCRRCSSTQIACLRPWQDDAKLLLRDRRLSTSDRRERDRLIRNAQVVSTYGAPAIRALVARGIGADTAARILQKTSDLEDPRFWREVLEAELTFARTNAYWKR